jgi:hypothetical protein
MAIPFVAFNAPGPQGPPGAPGVKGDVGPAGPAGSSVTPGTAGQLFVTTTTASVVFVTASGDVSMSTATVGKFTVTSLQGFIAISGTPTLGQTLVATSGTAAAWTTVNSFTAGGDLVGSSTAQYVVSLSGTTSGTAPVTLRGTYLGISGSTTYGTLGEIRTVDGGSGTDVIGGYYSGTTYVLMAHYQNELVLGADVNGANQVSYTSIYANVAVGLYSIAYATWILYGQPSGSVVMGAGSFGSYTGLGNDVGNLGVLAGWGSTPYVAAGYNATTFSIGMQNATSDVAPGVLTIQGAYAYSSASTHKTAGSILIDIGAPISGSTTEASIKFTRNAVLMLSIGNTSSTASFIQSSTSVSSLTVGSSTAGAALFLQADAAHTVIGLTTAASNTESVLSFYSPDGTFRGEILCATNGVIEWSDSGPNAIVFNGNVGINIQTYSTSNILLNDNGAVQYGIIGPNGWTVGPGHSATTSLLAASTNTSFAVGSSTAGAVLLLQGDASVTGILVGDTNIQLCSGTAAFAGGTGVVGITNATTIPSSTPSGGGVLYASNGKLYWRGSSGTLTTLAVA